MGEDSHDEYKPSLFMTNNTNTKDNTVKITDIPNNTDKDSKGNGDSSWVSGDGGVVSDYPHGSVVAGVVVLFTAVESFTASSEGANRVASSLLLFGVDVIVDGLMMLLMIFTLLILFMLLLLLSSLLLLLLLVMLL